MGARIVSRVAFWIGIAAALAMPLVSPVYRWFNPPLHARSDPQGFWENVGAALNSLNSLTDGIAIFLWMGGLASLAIIASVVAFIAAWRARESRSRKVLCGLPLVLVPTIWLILVFLRYCFY